MAINPGQAAYRITFQLSPIILTGGIAALIPGGMLPLLSISQALDFTFGLLGGSVGAADLDNFFANFEPLPGATLIDNQIGTYPFANQSVAANAIIAQPLKVSLLMLAPARDTGGYATKLATMMAMQATFAQHNQSGGTYTVATPSYFYTNCIMTGMQSVAAPSKQVQIAWRFDFAKPLVTLQDAQQAQNALMSKISAGTMFNGAPGWSGLGQLVNQPWTASAPAIVPAASNPAAAGNAPFPADDTA